MLHPGFSGTFFMATITTPCIDVCVLDPVSDMCRGCGRTVEEIAAWASLGEAERARIMADLPARIANVKPPAGTR